MIVSPLSVFLIFWFIVLLINWILVISGLGDIVCGKSFVGEVVLAVINIGLCILIYKVSIG